jgi:CheY-like chemotaxis protein
MKCLLQLEGHTVATAADGGEALETLRAGLQPGLILLDLMMPHVDGFQFRKAQLKDPRLSSIPVAVYSGHHDPMRYAGLLNAVAYFRKPVEVETLLEIVETHCRRPTQAQAN